MNLKSSREGNTVRWIKACLFSLIVAASLASASNLYRRDDIVFRTLNSYYAPGASYTVHVLPPGGEVASGVTGFTQTLRAGHGFHVGQKMMVGLNVAKVRTIDAVTATTIHVTQNVSTASGDILWNLGAETGTSSALNWDDATIPVYSDMGAATRLSPSMVTSDSGGRYGYWTTGIEAWEVIRTSGGSIATGLRQVVKANQTPTALAARDFATSGIGTQADPWATAGSNPLQAALLVCPTTGCTIWLDAGYFDLGTADPAVDIPILTSGVDRRTYVFNGPSRDLTFLNYHGTGSAFRYAQVNAGTPGSSYQSNQLAFRRFSLLQTGTPRTGTGFYMTYLSDSIWEDVGVGTLRVEGGSGEPDNGFATGIKLDGTPGDNVTDFNRFYRLMIRGNTLGMYIGNQGDNTRIEGCDFEPQQLSTSHQNAIEIHNSNAVSFVGNHCNYFGKNTGNSDWGCLRFSGLNYGHTVSGNYFEGNAPYSVELYTDQTQLGYTITGNMVSMTGLASGAGFRIGNSGGPTVTGANISGNAFQALGAGTTGIKIENDALSVHIGTNGFANTGGTNISNSSPSFIQEFDSVSGFPRSLSIYNSYDLASTSVTTSGLRLEQTFTGNNAATANLEGIFSIQKMGAAGVGGNTSAPTIALGGYMQMNGSSTNNTNATAGAELATTVNNTATMSAAMGAIATVETASGGTSTITSAYGVQGQSRINSGGTGTYTNAYGVQGVVSQAGAGTITNAYAGNFQCNDTGAGSITNCYGVYIPAVSGGAQENYGLRVGTASGGASVNYSFKVDGGSSRIDGGLAVGACADTASAGTIGVDLCNVVTITGSTAITTINTCNAFNKGRVLYILCGTATSAFVDLSMTNVKMAGNFTCTGDDSLTLICDGTNWIEQSRSVN